jgi:hypothetical protein
MYAVIRRYTGAAKLIEALDRTPQEIERLMSAVPGFVAYHAVRAGDTLVTVSVCNDRTGTDETTRRAAQWVRDNVPAGAVGAPEITEGESFIDFAASQTRSTGAART